jgi:hypothetical protein
MRDLIKPIHEGQKMSESTHSSINKVYPRWVALQRHLLKITDPATFPFADDIKGYLKREHGGFKARIERQVQTPHLLAYILNPANRTTWEDYSKSNQQRVTQFVEDYGGVKALKAFFDYLNQEGDFHPINHY